MPPARAGPEDARQRLNLNDAGVAGVISPDGHSEGAGQFGLRLDVEMPVFVTDPIAL
jgi:hypothetical protein